MNKFTSYYMTSFKEAKLSDISKEQIALFTERAKSERKYSFSGRSDVESTLRQLVLLDGKKLTNAALMLFGKNPQQFCPAAIVKCSHYYGTEETRPIPSQQNFGGTLFEQIELAVDFVLSRLNRTVEGREYTTVAEARMEIPKEAIREIIVNAVVHRDYDSNGSVQITVFADRVEIINPGGLPNELTTADLSKKHVSVPVNPFLARPFYLAAYINQLGSGTLRVIEYCRKAHLPSPTFDDHLKGQFRVTLWRDRFTDDVLNSLGVSDRQRKGVNHVKEVGRIANADYQQISDITRKTATRDLDQLVEKGILKRMGEKRGTFYVLGDGPAY